MAKSKYAGVTLVDPNNKSSFWQYRIKIKSPDGKTVDTKIRKDSNGNPFMTARAAFEAKMAHEDRIKNPVLEAVVEPHIVTLQDVYSNYLETEAKKKAAATLRKQDSMWRNHIYPLFGEKDINSITLVELDSFLFDLYKTHAYKYVEGFLKFFYLLFSHSHKMEVIESERYLRMFVTRGTRLKMPEMTQQDHIEEEKGAVVYTEQEIKLMYDVVKDTTAEIPFRLGLHCGLRISECYGLRWRDIDFDNCVISVSRQLQYVDGKWVLTGVKTLRSVRKIYITKKMSDDLWDVRSFQIGYKKKLKEAYRDNERVYDEMEKRWLDVEDRDFVNRKDNGELLTINSMKYWTKQLNSVLRQYAEEMAAIYRLGNCGQYVEVNYKEFKYHNLRHTFATICASHNMNFRMLMQFMGHLKVDTTQKYYINTENEYLETHTRNLLTEICE